MASKTYSDEQQAEFCSLAQEIGIGRAIRELGYPSYPAAVKWMKARGIKPNVDQIMQEAKKWHVFYQTEDMLIMIDNGMAVIEELFSVASDADEVKKLAESIQKLVNARLILEGKANSISEKREVTQQDLEIAELLRLERMNQSQQHDSPNVS